MRIRKTIIISFAGVERTVHHCVLAVELKECLDAFYRRNAPVGISIRKALSIARRAERVATHRSGNDIGTIRAAAMYCLGVWNYIAENQTGALRYIHRYLAFARDNPSLRLPVSLPNKYRSIIETTMHDPNFLSLKELVKRDPKMALARIGQYEEKTGRYAIDDHMYYVLWAVAAFRAGHPQKAYWMSKKAMELSTRCTLTELVTALVSVATFTGEKREKGISLMQRIRRRNTSTLLYSPCSVAETKVKRLRRLVNDSLHYLKRNKSRLPESQFITELLSLL